MALLLKQMLMAEIQQKSVFEKKRMFRIKSSRFWGHHGDRPSNLTGWTTPGRKTIGIRAMLIQVGSQWDSPWQNQHEARDSCAHRGLSLPQHVGSSCCIHRAPAGQGEVGSMFTTPMLVARPDVEHLTWGCCLQSAQCYSPDELRVFVCLYINNCLFSVFCPLWRIVYELCYIMTIELLLFLAAYILYRACKAAVCLGVVSTPETAASDTRHVWICTVVTSQPHISLDGSFKGTLSESLDWAFSYFLSIQIAPRLVP